MRWRYPTRILLIFFLFEKSLGVSRILDRFERKLNSINDKMDMDGGGPRIVDGKIKRYRCIEEYVSVDERGIPLNEPISTGRPYSTRHPPKGLTPEEYDSPVSTTTSTLAPRTRPRMLGIKTIKTAEYAIPVVPTLKPDKPKKKKKKSRGRITMTPHTTTPPVPMTSAGLSDGDDPAADKLIEELFLSTKTQTTAQTTQPQIKVQASDSYSTDKSYYGPSKDTASPIRPQVRAHQPLSDGGFDILHKPFGGEVDEEEMIPMRERRRHPGNSRRYYTPGPRDYDTNDLDDNFYDDEIPYYMPMRRRYSGYRVRPRLRTDDERWNYYQGGRYAAPVVSDANVNYRRRTNHVYAPPQLMTTPRPLRPVAILPSTGQIYPQNTPSGVAAAPVPFMPPSLAPQRVAPQLAPVAPQMVQVAPQLATGQLPVAPSTPLPETGNSVLPAGTMENSSAANCAKIRETSELYQVKDVAKWARGNCGLLQMWAPTFTCEQIWHFIDSCQKKHFL